MTDAPQKPHPATPPGTWPLLVSGALLLLAVPALLLGQVVPQWLAIAGAVLFLAVAIACLVWSYLTYQKHRERRSRGIPIAGIVLGVISMLVAALVVVPAALGSPAPSPDLAVVDTDVAAEFAIDRDFPDPDVLEVDGVYYAYATQSGDYNVQVATSTDLVTFDYLDTDPLPDLPGWAVVGDTWAPEVTRVGESFVMYFTAANPIAGRQCIGVATSLAPDGPFEPVGDEPLVCPVEDGGAIDAATFTDDDGALYLLWKNDGNAVAHDTIIHIAPLTADGLAVAGDATDLIQQDQAWEGRLVEAPTLVKHDGRYVLFYSANDYYGLDYAIGYATAESLLGPYTKSLAPLLSTDSSDFAYYGPGGQDVVGESIVFHSWSADHTYRGMHVAPLGWVGAEPVVVLPRPVD